MPAVADAALQELLSRGLEDFLSAESGNHQAPVSPMVTTLINILHADLWRHWGYAPTFALGHSIGEVAAAYTAGLFSLDEAIVTAHVLGRAGSACAAETQWMIPLTLAPAPARVSGS